MKILIDDRTKKVLSEKATWLIESQISRGSRDNWGPLFTGDHRYGSFFSTCDWPVPMCLPVCLSAVCTRPITPVIRLYLIVAMSSGRAQSEDRKPFVRRPRDLIPIRQRRSICFFTVRLTRGNILIYQISDVRFREPMNFEASRYRT